MVRKLVLSLLSLMVLIPVSGWGLGLGDIRLNSFLNQPLDAEIDLLSVQEEDVESMTVNLASYETFARLGIERPSSLMFLKFSLEKGADERYRIKVYTKNPIKEPYLNFLLDVNWRSGRQLREYTLLLDPPDMLKQQGAPVTTAPAVSTTTERTPVAARSAPADTGAATTRVTPTPSPAPAMTSAAGDLVYGPVKSDDTLWSIAKRMRPSGDVSIYQMMMAIYQANPDAFHGGNINRLKKGKVLRVDDPASLRAMSRAEASREVMRHDREWQDYKQAVAGDASSRMAGMAPMQEAPSAAVAEDARLELVAPEKEGELAAEAGAGAADSGLQNELMLAMESVEAKSRENAELSARLQELEAQVASMERLLTLKDDDLAALQKQLQDQSVEAAVTTPEETLVAPETEVPGAAEEGVEVVAEEPQPITSAEETAEQLAEAAPEEVVEPEPVPVVAEEEPRKLAKPAPLAPVPAPAPSIIDELLGNQMVVIGGGALVVLLLILGMIMVRRRRQESFQESILSGGTSSMLRAGEEGEGASQTSFLSDLTVSGMGEGAGDESEVDPLTEADVYMAYGRYEQAEELLKDAIGKAPRRHELVVKLLELYHSTKNAEAFSSVAADSKSALQDNEAHWNKVLAMGFELCPDDPMFAAGAHVAGTFEAGAGESAESDVLDIGLDLDALTEEMESGEGEGDEFEFDLGLDLGDMEDSDEEKPKGSEAVAAEPAKSVESLSESIDEPLLDEEESFDLDFSAMSEESAATDELSAPASEEQKEDELASSLDFDLDFELPTDIATHAEAAEPEAKTKSENSLDFDIGDLDLSDTAAAAVEMESEETDALDMGELNFDEFDLEESAEPETAVPSDALADLGDLGESLGGEDEVSTKLDLARAYVEMGDEDGAREMLEEVIEDGNDEQKKEAEELMQKLS